TVRVNAAEADADRESVTTTVNAYPPGDAPVVPDRTPAEEKVIPLGRSAGSGVAQVNGPVPPDSGSVWVNGTPTDAVFRVVVVMEIPGTRMVRELLMPKLDPASVALNVHAVPDPATVGVPEITPAADTDRPVGRVPVFSVHVYGAAPP